MFLTSKEKILQPSERLMVVFSFLPKNEQVSFELNEQVLSALTFFAFLKATLRQGLDDGKNAILP